MRWVSRAVSIPLIKNYDSTLYPKSKREAIITKSSFCVVLLRQTIYGEPVEPMEEKIYISESPENLKSFAARFLEEKMRSPRARALVVSLVGNLGAGKTTFVQGAAESLGVTRAMPSPTFTLMREVELPREVKGITMIYHFDWFRLEHEADIVALGWDDIIKDPKNLVLVEWGDKFPQLFPKGTYQITLSHK